MNPYNYSIPELEHLLTNYWLLVEGTMPRDGEPSRKQGRKSLYRAPFENTAIAKTDLDLGIDRLGRAGSWLWQSIGITPERAKKVFRYLNEDQKIIVGWYLLGKSRYLYETKPVLAEMRDRLNEGLPVQLPQ